MGAASTVDVRLVGTVTWEEASPSVYSYTLSFADASGEWHVTRRYSRWRSLHDHVHGRWPRALLEPTALSFPPKALVLLRPSSDAFVSERAAGIERFVARLLQRARNEDAHSGLADWLAHWLRFAREPGPEEPSLASAAPAAAPLYSFQIKHTEATVTSEDVSPKQQLTQSSSPSEGRPSL